MPPVPPQMFPRISTISPIGGERSNAADAQAVRRQTTVTRAPRSRARLRVVTTRRRLMAQPCTPHPSSPKPAMSGVEGNAPRLSLGVQKGVFSSEREYPLCIGSGAKRRMINAAQRAASRPLEGGKSKGSTDSDEHTDPVRQQRDDAARDDDAEEDDRHGAL